MDPVVSGNLIAVLLFVGSVATLVMGVVADKAGAKLFTVFMGVLLVAGNILVGMGGAAVLFACIAGIIRQAGSPITSTGPSVLVMEGFGRRAYESVLGPQQAMLNLGAAIATPVFGAIIVAMGYAIVFHISGILCAAGGILVLLALRASPYQPAKGVKAGAGK